MVEGGHGDENIDFYVAFIDIIGLKYLGEHIVWLFKCDWWDVSNPRLEIHTMNTLLVSIHPENGMKMTILGFLARQVKSFTWMILSTRVLGKWYKNSHIVIFVIISQKFRNKMKNANFPLASKLIKKMNLLFHYLWISINMTWFHFVGKTLSIKLLMYQL